MQAHEQRITETKKTPLHIYISVAVLISLIFLLDLNVPLGVAVVILYNAVVLVALGSKDRRFIFTIAVLTSLFTIIALIHKSPVDDMWKAISNRTLALFSIWVETYLGVQRLHVDDKREKALTERENALQEVRILRGFIPICASCKKIRDLGGTWTLMERYISEHSEAEFSHGLCPDCTKQLFPQFFPKEPEKGQG